MSVQETLTETLREHAEGDVDTAALLARSVARGRRLRLRRKGSLGLAAVAVVGAAVTVPVVLPSMPAGQQAGAPPAATLQPQAVPLPPLVMDKETLEQNPAALGSDPTLLHLSVDSLPPRAASTGGLYGDGSPSTSWASFDGSEYLGLQHPVVVDFWAGAWAEEQVENFGPVRGGAVINGKPAVLYQSEEAVLVLWQPLEGVLVAARGLSGTTADQVVAAAEELRFDRVSRCAVGFTVQRAPAGAGLYRCDVGYSPAGPSNGHLVYRKSDGSTMDIRHLGNEVLGAPPNAIVAGEPANWQSGEAQGVTGEILMAVPTPGHKVIVLIHGAFTRQEAEQVVAGLRWP